MVDAPVTKRAEESTTRGNDTDVHAKLLAASDRGPATERSLSNITPVADKPKPTEASIANDWDKAAKLPPDQQKAALGKLSDDIAAKTQATLSGSKDDPKAAVAGLEKKINESIVADGAVQLKLSGDGKQLSVGHLRAATSEETAKLATMTREQQSQAGVMVAENGNKEKVYAVPAVGDSKYDLSTNPPKKLETSKPAELTEKKMEAPKWGDDIPGAAKVPPSPYVWAGISQAVGNELKQDPNWKPVNAAQAEMLKASKGLEQEVNGIPKSVLDSVAGTGADGVAKVNKLFKDHNIPINLRDAGKDAISAGSVFDFKADWKGLETKLQTPDGKEYPAFQKDVRGYKVGNDTVLEVYRDEKNGFTMYMSPQAQDVKGYDAYKKAFELTPGAKTERANFTEAVIPKMSFRDAGEIPQLQGLQAAKGLSVDKALAFTSADFDQTGAQIKQGVAVQMTRSLSIKAEPFQVKEPPLVWVAYDNASKPVIAFQIPKKDWVDPKTRSN